MNFPFRKKSKEPRGASREDLVKFLTTPPSPPPKDIVPTEDARPKPNKKAASSSHLPLGTSSERPVRLKESAHSRSSSNLLPNRGPGRSPLLGGRKHSQDHGGEMPSQRTIEPSDEVPSSRAITTRLNNIITMMDAESFSNHHLSIMAWEADRIRDFSGAASSALSVADTEASLPVRVDNLFSKVWAYGNSRLPPRLPPLKVYVPTYPLLCVAASYSMRAYDKPTKAEKETHIEADSRHGTKAMLLKSVPLDDLNTIVLAIRGTSSFTDWAVNVRDAPASTEGFLDDPGNLCHRGFLNVAQSMVSPIARRLRILLASNPRRKESSLVFTGHSAGGAIAALLYSHMLSSSSTVPSELRDLRGSLKRIHCITFGAPPVTLLPLQKPANEKKSLFFAFINEGDPVARADKNAVGSLLRLYLAPIPPQVNVVDGKRPVWKLPETTLSNAGRLVLLREKTKGGMEKVTASVVTDEQLRGVVFGDPLTHPMALYERRVKKLATQAVTGGIG